MTATAAIFDRTIESVSQDAMLAWCDALHDDNPIHLDPAAAQALGFGSRTVNPGPANLAYLIALMMDARPADDIAQIDAAFLGHASAGDRLQASAVPAADAPDTFETLLARDEVPLVMARIALRPRCT